MLNVNGLVVSNNITANVFGLGEVAEPDAKAFAKFMLPIGKPNKIDENWILFKQPF